MPERQQWQGLFVTVVIEIGVVYVEVDRQDNRHFALIECRRRPSAGDHHRLGNATQTHISRHEPRDSLRLHAGDIRTPSTTTDVDEERTIEVVELFGLVGEDNLDHRTNVPRRYRARPEVRVGFHLGPPLGPRRRSLAALAGSPGRTTCGSRSGEGLLGAGSDRQVVLIRDLSAAACPDGGSAS